MSFLEQYLIVSIAVFQEGCERRRVGLDVLPRLQQSGWHVAPGVGCANLLAQLSVALMAPEQDHDELTLDNPFEQCCVS